MSGRMFTVPMQNDVTEAVIDTDQTMIAVYTANTLGHRCRIREIALGCSEDAPVDLMIGISLMKSDNAGAGTKTAVTPEKCDSLSLASIISAGKKYTDEPTDYGIQLFNIEMHLQNTLLKEWNTEDAPVCGQNELIGLVVTIRTGAIRTLSGYIKFEEF